MRSRYIGLFLLIFLVAASVSAGADQAVQPLMRDETLVSFIQGQVKLTLSDDAAAVREYCDASGCAVVVQ